MFQVSNVPNSISTVSTGTNPEWHSATGPLLIPMTNDYLFRALLQHNNQVLKALISSLLHLPIKEVRSVAIINPILLGESIDEKTFFLDVFVVLNNYTRINLELQVINERNWPERSLSYLCRTFDNLNSGENYSVVKPAIQIGLLDFTLFPEYPEFYSTYQFMNIKNYTIYSDKMRLSVLNLTRKDLSTEEDQKFHLHHWASFFKAATWEELKMLAKQDEFIDKASATIYQLSQEEQIRLQCEAREDYYRRQRTIQYNLNKLDEQKDTIESQNTTIERQNATIEEQKINIEKQNTAIEEQKINIEKQNTTIEEQKINIEKQNTTIEKQKINIEKQNTTIKQLTDKVASQETELTSLRDEITSLRKLLSDVLESAK